MEYREKYEYWLHHPNLTDEMRKELEQMSEKQIEDAFYTECAV